MRKALFLILTLSLGAIAKDIIEQSLEQARAGNYEQAREIIEDAAVSDDAEAQYLLSKYYREPDGLNQLKVSEEWLLKSAKNGFPDAQYYYAWDLSSDWKTSSVERLSKVVYWFEKAGYNGSDKAYANLGALYDNDERDVLKEIEDLANKGDSMAQYNIGWINGRGLLTEDGLKQDEDAAKVWFEKAAEQGFQDAVDVLKRNF